MSARDSGGAENRDVRSDHATEWRNHPGVHVRLVVSVLVSAGVTLIPPPKLPTCAFWLICQLDCRCLYASSVFAAITTSF